MNLANAKAKNYVSPFGNSLIQAVYFVYLEQTESRSWCQGHSDLIKFCFVNVYGMGIREAEAYFSEHFWLDGRYELSVELAYNLNTVI